MSATRLRVAGSPTAPAEVRAWLAQQLPDRADIELAVHEALCNCIEHAVSVSVTIDVRRRCGDVEVELIDDGRPWIEPEASDDLERGRGITMIAALAHSTERAVTGAGNRLVLRFPVR